MASLSGFFSFYGLSDLVMDKRVGEVMEWEFLVKDTRKPGRDAQNWLLHSLSGPCPNPKRPTPLKEFWMVPIDSLSSRLHSPPVSMVPALLFSFVWSFPACPPALSLFLLILLSTVLCPVFIPTSLSLHYCFSVIQLLSLQSLQPQFALTFWLYPLSFCISLSFITKAIQFEAKEMVKVRPEDVISESMLKE